MQEKGLDCVPVNVKRLRHRRPSSLDMLARSRSFTTETCNEESPSGITGELREYGEDGASREEKPQDSPSQ